MHRSRFHVCVLGLALAAPGFAQGVHRYHQVPRLWNVDEHGHDGETWGSNLYSFAQRIFR